MATKTAAKSDRTPAAKAGNGEYGIPELVRDINGFLSSHLSQYGLIENIGRMIRRAIKNPKLLAPEHMAPRKDRYARNFVHKDPASQFVVMSLVWGPGQGTPIHDHGTWGVMGVYKNELEAVNYKRLDDGSDEDYADLRETGSLVLGAGSLAWVLPPNEEIHLNRNSSDEPTITIHVYGKEITGYHRFDLATKRVTWYEIPTPS